MVTDTSAMDFRLSDFLSAADTDDDAIARMLAAGKSHPSRTYHFDVPVTIRRAIPLPSDTTILVEADIRQADGTFDCVFRGANVALDDDLAFLPPVVEPLRNIRIVGARSAPATNACVTSNVPCADVRVERCAAGNGVLAELADEAGFSFADCTGKVNAYPGYRNLD